ncbi:MAG: putative Ig domain-containing protein [Acidobacteria bacterium]|nr:putative Ig domain-containing protein [Acidobacteriota bacterium]
MKTYRLVVFLVLLGLAVPAFGQLTITTASPLPDAMVSRAYNAPLAATGGTGTLTWTLEPPPPSLPAGLTVGTTVSPAGAVSGTPTASGTFTFSIKVTDSASPTPNTATKSFTMTVRSSLGISTSSIPAATVGAAYNSGPLTATGGSGSYTWNITGLPSGLGFSSSTGAITGTPSSVGASPYALTVNVQDTSTPTFSDSKQLTLTISAGLTITTATPLPNATANQSYSQTFTGSGGTGTGYAWTLAVGSTLPAGLTLTTGGVLSGTPTAAGGPTSFTVRLTDSSTAFVEQAFSLTVNPALVINTVSPLANGSVGTAYSQTLVATGGSGSGYSFIVSVGTLPAGLLLSTGGVISGTPTAGGASTFTVQVTDSQSRTATKQFTITITAPLSVTTVTLATGAVGSAYSQTLAASGGTNTGYTWAVTVGALPGGLTLTQGTGAITGTPTTTTGSPFNFTVQVTDSGNATATKPLSIAVNPALSITTNSLAAGTVGTAYNQTLTASGGSGIGYAWSVATGALPGGLTLSSGGVITGTPTAGGTFNFTVQLADSTGASITKALSITVNSAGSALTITTNTPLPNATVTLSYTQTFTATGGSGTGYTWTVPVGTPPAGLTLTTGGVLSGTPTAAGGPTSFTVRVTDSASAFVDKAFSVTVNQPLVINTSSPLTTGTVGVGYSQTLVASGGSGSGYGFAVTVGSLPTGLTLSSGGLISGTPTAGGTFNFTAQVTDSQSNTATKQFSLTISGGSLTITTPSLPSWTINANYSQTMAATGGVLPYTWSISGGSLPAGLSIATNTGIISGAPTAAGNSTFTVRVQDSASGSTTQQYTVTINQSLLVLTGSVPNGVVGTGYSTTLGASGGTAPLTWSLAAGTLPAGLSLNAGSGVISGTPTATVTAQAFTVQVLDAAGTSAARPLSMSVTTSTLTITTATIPNPVLNSGYSTTFAANGGSGTGYSWTLPAGNVLPTGLTLTTGGVLQGTPTVPGTFSFNVQVSDSVGNVVSRGYTVTVTTSSLTISSNTPLNEALVGNSYTAALVASGGSGTGYVFTIVQGALPSGLTMNNAGIISGTPTAFTVVTFTVQLADSLGTTVTKSFTLAVASTLLIVTTVSPLPDANVGTPYAASISASGGVGSSYVFTTTSTLPNGMTLAANGTLQGTPTQAGTFPILVQVVDGVGGAANKPLTLTVTQNVVTITTSTLPSGAAGNPYNATLTASGGGLPYTWQLTVGLLPPGLTLATNGTISGTPTTPGTYNFRVRVRDVNNLTADADLSIQIVTFGITTLVLPDATVGAAYSMTLAAIGGALPYTWSVASGSTLPSGLSLSTGGVLSGTPATAGRFNFTVQVRDNANSTATQPFTLNVGSNLSITTQTLPAGVVGSAYDQTLQATGGIAPYTWLVISGALPVGLTLNGGTGRISGTPSTTIGSPFNFTVQVTDNAGVTGSKPFTIMVSSTGSTVTITTAATLPNAVPNVAYNQTLAATGGVLPYTWTITAGALPIGIALSTGGAIAGTTTQSGTFQFTARVADSSTPPLTASRAFTLVVAQSGALTISTASLPNGTVGTGYPSTTLVSSGGTQTGLSWTVTLGTVPPGLSVSPAGVVSGTPNALGTYTFTVQVTDSAGGVATKQFQIVVGGGTLTISTQSLSNGIVGSPYSATTLTATGGTGSYSWTLSGQPAGLSISTIGVLTGTPTSAGTYNLVVQVSDTASASATKTFQIVVALAITPQSLPAGVLNSPYAAVTLQAVGGTTPYAWAVVSGELPNGLTLSPAGVVSGTPTLAGPFSATVRVTDAAGASGQITYNVQITALTITTPATITPGAVVGTPYTTTLGATGGLAPYQWIITAGLLPIGVTLTPSTGTLSGTPTAPGTYQFTARVADSSNPQQTASQTFTLAVASGTLAITTTTLPNALLGQTYNLNLTASGAVGALSWSVTSGLLPTGIGLNSSSGLLTGIPTVAGTYTITIQLVDAGNNASVSRQFNLVVVAPLTITTTALQGGTSGVFYNQTLAASGGTTTGYTWSLLTGSLPPGLTLNSANGVISGTPTSTGPFNFTVQLSDSSGGNVSKALSITIGTTLSITTSALPVASTGVAYTQALSASGGTPQLSWSISSVTGLPPGLALGASTGVITGSATTPGTYTFTVRVQDSTGASATRDLSIVVMDALSITTPTALPDAAENTAYTQTLRATGGTTPYAWTVSVGTLPAGLSLNASTGGISGTPTTAGSYSFIIQLTDAAQQTVQKAFTLVVGGRVTVVTQTLPNATARTFYIQNLIASGGTPPYSWSLAGGNPPLGLTIDAGGVLSGTPSNAGVFTFTVQVADSVGGTGTRTLTLSVVQGLSINTPSPLPTGVAGTPFTQVLAATGGTPPYAWSATGNLPPGVTLSTAGVLSGIPAGTGTFNFSVQVSDVSGGNATADFAMTIGLPARPTLTITGLSDTIGPAQQPRIGMSLGASYPLDLAGTLTMTFTPDAAVPLDDPAVVFTNGSRTVNFTVPANSTNAQLPAGFSMQSGTVAGTIGMAVTLRAAGQDVTPSPAPALTAKINRDVPVIRGLRATRASGGLSVEITGYSTPREVASATFRFTPAAGSTLQTTEITVQLGDGARAWYQNEQSRLFGSQFTLTQQFNVQGDTSAISSVTVTLTNAVGNSQAANASFQ